MGWPAVLGAIGAAALSTASSGGLNAFNANITDINAKKAWQRGMESQYQAQDFSSGEYAKRYQTTVNDMYLAGLNPILAASSGFNVGGQPVGSGFSPPSGSVPAQSTAKDLVSDWATLEKTRSEVAKNEADAEEKLNRAALAFASIETEFKKQYNLIAQTEKFSQEGHAAAQSGLKMIAEMPLIAKKIHEVAMNIRLLKATKERTQADDDRIRQQTKNLMTLRSEILVKIKKLQAELPKIEREGQVYKDWSGKILTQIREVFDAINLHIGVILNPKE